MLKYALASLASAGVLMIPACSDYATIGDHEVKGLHCEEDEIIGFNPDSPSNELECFHEDVFIARYREQQVND